MLKKIAFYLSILLTVSACSALPEEVVVQTIELAAPLNNPKAELSGLAWCQDKLVLLPQYPGFEDALSPSNNPLGNLYILELAQLEAYLASNDPEPLRATAVPLIEHRVRDQVYQFDGFEAIACDGMRMWLSMETIDEKGSFVATIVGASISLAGESTKVSIEPQALFTVASQSEQHNAGDEALLFHQDSLISFHEINSDLHVEQAHAVEYGLNNADVRQLRFPSLAYRLTDVTSVDANGRFWGTNYQWQGAKHLQQDKDTLFSSYKRGSTHGKEANVERIIEFELAEGQVTLSEAAPIQLQLTNEKGRNWEGIVRYKDQGFLLVTDEYPETRLGFVPFAN